MKNNDQRKEWLRNHKSWGLWYTDSHTGARYYKYDFDNGARLGLTLADNLVGGVNKYLAKNKNYIKKRIVSMFDATGEIAKLSGDFSIALADI